MLVKAHDYRALHLQHFVEALQRGCVGAQARDLLHSVGERAQLVGAPRTRRVQQLRQLHDAARAGTRPHQLLGQQSAALLKYADRPSCCTLLSFFLSFWQATKMLPSIRHMLLDVHANH
jgi:hypothetical protein